MSFRIRHAGLRAAVWFASGGWALLFAGCGDSKPVTPARSEWRELFDGESLAGWRQSPFEGESGARVVTPFRDGRGAIIIEAGTTLSGVTWIDGSELPRTNYEVALEAMRLAGSDFFCGLTFPIGDDACTFIVGGWGGTMVGISSIDDVDASENETSTAMEFEDNRWYRIRVRVTDAKLQAWIDDVIFVDIERQGRTFSLRPGDIQKSLPLGIATYMTRAAIRDVRLRQLPPANADAAQR